MLRFLLKGKLVAAGLLVATLASCGGQDPSPTAVVPVQPAKSDLPGLQGVAEIVPFARSLVDALIVRGAPTEPYTLFVPLDEALSVALSASGLDLSVLVTDKVLANQLLDIHTLSGALSASDFRQRNGETLQLVSGDVVTAVVDPATDDFFLQSSDGSRSEIIATDLTTDIGVVHVIDTPIRVP